VKAVQFVPSVPLYVLGKLVGPHIPGVYWSRWSCLQFRDVPEPDLPGPDWVRVRVTMGGICGSDLNLITLHDTPTASVYTSFPFTIGHETVGRVAEVGPRVAGLRPGQRVVVDPVLSCAARGFDTPCPACQRGDLSLCHRRTEGRLSPGLLIGGCRDTSGSWSPYLVAHESQVTPLPDDVADEDAVLVDPFACALHAVLRNPPPEGGTALVIGAGVVGLCVVAALRALDLPARIVALARHGFQADLAERFGAHDVVLVGSDDAYYEDVARLSGGRVLRPILGRPVVHGGVPTVYECVGSDRSLDDALRFAAPSGRVVLLGLAGVTRRVDWTPIWLNELQVVGSFICSTERYREQTLRTYDLAVRLLAARRVGLGRLVTHRFPLVKYREAIATALGKRRTRAIKVVLEP
jgi:threonine dehydrogenase-like Zn-dependent dehydrogenase